MLSPHHHRTHTKHQPKATGGVGFSNITQGIPHGDHTCLTLLIRLQVAHIRPSSSGGRITWLWWGGNGLIRESFGSLALIGAHLFQITNQFESLSKGALQLAFQAGYIGFAPCNQYIQEKYALMSKIYETLRVNQDMSDDQLKNSLEPEERKRLKTWDDMIHTVKMIARNQVSDEDTNP